MRKYFYIIILIFIIIFIIFKVGFFDSKNVKIDNFTIEKPFLFRNLNSNLSQNFNNNFIESFIFLSNFKQESILYTIKKVKSIDEYKFRIRNLKLNINIDSCYIKKEKITLKKGFIEKINVYKYPYLISFNELNKKREKKSIKEFCKTSEIIKVE